MAKLKKNLGSEHYRIKVKGRLDKKWSGWFDDLKISFEKEDTIISGLVADQAALHGILNRIRDLNLILVSVELIDYAKKDQEAFK